MTMVCKLPCWPVFYIENFLLFIGRTAFIGIGFGDRSDSFDLNVALQDHFKWLKKEKQISEEPSGPALDLGFKEGETIKINMKISVSGSFILLYGNILLHLLLLSGSIDVILDVKKVKTSISM